MRTVRRVVFHIAGYDPVSPREHYERFKRQLKIFQTTWGVRSSVSDIEEQGSFPHWTVLTDGPGWQVEARYELLRWDDIIQRESQGSRFWRLARGLGVYGNLLVTGTLWRYLRANSRYFIFALVPLFQILLLLVVAGSL